MDPILGQIMLFAGNFAPRGWAFCNGQLLAISTNQALFSLLGTTYGGNGQTTFGLPDLRGRAPIHVGQGPGLSDRILGQHSGAENVTLTVTQMPAHNHQVFPGFSNTPAVPNPAGAYPSNIGQNVYGTTHDGSMGAANVSSAGGSLPHNNMQPFLAMNFCICIAGAYPARN